MRGTELACLACPFATKDFLDAGSHAHLIVTGPRGLIHGRHPVSCDLIVIQDPYGLILHMCGIHS